MIASAWPKDHNTHATPQEVSCYDIHVKHLDDITYTLDDRLQQITELEKETATLKKGPLNTVASETFLRTLQKIDEIHKQPRQITTRAEVQLMELSTLDIETYARHKLIVPDEHPDTRSNLRLFSTIEEKPLNQKPKRRRGITHTPMDNLYAKDFDKVQLVAPVQQAHVVKHAAICVDFQAFFNQLRLGTRRQYWGFTDGHGRDWRITTLPTGATFSPLIAELLTSTIARWLEARCPGIRADTFIDNIRISGNDEYAARWATDILMTKLEELNIQVNETRENIQTMDVHNFQYLGIIYDLTEPKDIRITITNKLANKITAILADTNMHTHSMRKILSYFGIITFASMVLLLPRAKYYTLLKYMRRRASQATPLDSAANIWPTALNTLKRWCTDILTRQTLTTIPRHDNTLQHWHVFTDASNHGYGSVILTPTETIIDAGKWTAAESDAHINIKEAAALLRAAKLTNASATSRRITPTITYHVDNTSVIGAVRNTTSRSFELNDMVDKLNAELNITRTGDIEYVESSRNIADLPSRQTIYKKFTAQTGIFRKSMLTELFTPKTQI
jgi:hypothetical protein